MPKYWTSRKSQSVVGDRRDELDLLLDFANDDINQGKNQVLQAQILDCLRQHPALHPDNRMRKTDGKIARLMRVLQQHLLSRLSSIIENKIMLAEMPLWPISGTVKFTLNPIQNRFHERFRLRKVKPGNEVKALKKICDLWLIEIIRDLDFSPRRFGQCQRCGAIFCSPTVKERTYCSTRCSNAARQQKFRKGRRKIDK